MREHGTRAKYAADKCRCEPCRRAYSTHIKEWKANRYGPRTHGKRWPIQPLFDAAKTTQVFELAYLTGIPARTIHRWMHAGISDHQADRAAIALGLHPSLIWTEWFDIYKREAA
jgi:hypothetical protein